jgi:hypothetical protein
VSGIIRPVQLARDGALKIADAGKLDCYGCG